MKGLIITSLVVAALIGVGIIVSIIITDNLGDEVTATREHGFEEGLVQGYEEGFRDGYRASYQEGGRIGYEESRARDSIGFGEGSYFTYNPAFREVQAILKESGKTSAIEIIDYTEANGIRTAYVRCQIARETTDRMVHVYHLVAFDTIDKGFIIIRPRSYEELKVEIGESYSELNGFPTPSYDDTVTKITIVW